MARRGHPAHVKALLDEISIEVAALPKDALRALSPILFEAEQELKRDLVAWIQTAEDGDARFTAQHYRRALLQIQGAMNCIADVEPQLAEILGVASHQAGRFAIGHLQKEFARWAPEFEGTVAPMPFNVASILARGDRLLIPRFRTSAARYVGAVRDDIRKQLGIGLIRGETIHQLTNRLVSLGGPAGVVSLRGVLGERGAIAERIAEGLFRRYRYWGERVVRTEVLEAYNTQADEGIRDAHELDPELKRRWCGELDNRLCDICRRYDGEVVGVDKPFRGGVDHPPLHPNCFPPGTRVLTSQGWRAIETVAVGDLVLTHRRRWRRVEALSRSRFDGSLVVVSNGPHVVAATPNHPFATPQGWVGAERLGIESAQVLALSQGAAVVAEDAPASSHEEGLLGLPSLARARVPVAAVDLDGDHLFGHAEVDVVLADGLADVDAHSERAQSSSHRHFRRGPADALLRSSALLKVPVGASLTSNRLVRSVGDVLALVRAHVRVAAAVVFGHRARDAGALQDALDRRSAAAEAMRQRHRCVACQVKGDDLGFGQGDRLHSGIVVCDPALSSRSYAGPVYNFQVADDESYIAEGFVVHNCRCAVVAWRADWERDRRGTAKKRAKAAPAVQPTPPVTSPSAGLRPLGDDVDLAELAGAIRHRDEPSARGLLRKIGDTSGLRQQDVGMPGADTLLVVPDFLSAGAAGWHKGDGTMGLAASVASDAQRGLLLLAQQSAAELNAAPNALMRDHLHAVKTMVHEDLHGRSPVHALAYTGCGRVVEEVTNELAAKRLMRETFGLSPKAYPFFGNTTTGGSYPVEIANVRRSIIDAFKAAGVTVEVDDVATALDNAAFDFKAHGEIIVNPAQAAEVLADKLDLRACAPRGKIEKEGAKAIRDDIARRLKVLR